MFKDYNINQVVLPLDMEMKLQENDIAYAVNELTESIPEEAFAGFLRATGCPLRDRCTKAKEGNNRRLYINETWENQKAYIREKLSEEKTGEIYGKRKIDVEPVFGFLKANLAFTRFSVRGNEKVKNEMGFAFMAVNLRKYTASDNSQSPNNSKGKDKKAFDHQESVIKCFFFHFRLVMSQPCILSARGLLPLVLF
ncbi:transposase [Amphibacillus cookii]|nr:transposase [Amphibacillus cookii]